MVVELIEHVKRGSKYVELTFDGERYYVYSDDGQGFIETEGHDTLSDAQIAFDSVCGIVFHNTKGV